MTEEEKKAIETLKSWKDYNIRNKNKLLEADKIIKVQETILNLINKLQKENEELKNEIMEKDLEIIGKEEYTKASMGEIIEKYYTANEDCVTKQKIKDKIEDLKMSGGSDGKDNTENTVRELVIEVLQEILNESEDSKDGEG